MSRKPRTPKGEWHHKTIVWHALRNWWKSTTPYAEQLLLPGMEPPPTSPRTAGINRLFILAVLAEARPDGTVIFAQDYAATVYAIGQKQYQREARFYKRRGVIVVTRRPAPGHPAVYSIQLPEWLRHFAPASSTVGSQDPPIPNPTVGSQDPASESTVGLEVANGGFSRPTSKRSKNHAAPRGSAGAALHDGGGTADDDAADADGAAPPPASKSNGSRPKSKTNDAPTPTPPAAADVLASDDRDPDDGFGYRPPSSGKPSTRNDPRRDVRARPPGWEQQQRQLDDDARAEAMAALARLADPNPEGDPE